VACAGNGAIKISNFLLESVPFICRTRTADYLYCAGQGHREWTSLRACVASFDRIHVSSGCVVSLLFLDFTGHSWNRGTATVPSFDHACRTVGQK
jgi:hypothetical protein